MHSLGIAFTLVFGIHHLLNETLFIGTLFLIASAFCASSFFNYEVKGESTNLFLAFLIVTSIAIGATCYFHGYRGLIYLFPFTIIWFYFFPFKSAITLSIVFSSISLLLASHSTDLLLITRFAAALVITVTFSASFAYVIAAQTRHLEKEAYYDALTGAVNRKEFIRWLSSALASPKEPEKSITLFYMDLDNFKYINDTHGHIYGDEILKGFSQRMINAIRQNELVNKTAKIHNFARLGGDEFALAIENIDSLNSVKAIANRLIESCQPAYQLFQEQIQVSTSIGIVYTNKKMDADTLIHNADIAMYRAKKKGKNTYFIYDESIHPEVARRQDIEKSIDLALKENKFSLSYMPIYSIKHGQVICGAELLIRGNSEIKNLECPEVFIPIAEASGQIKAITHWVIEQAFKNIAELNLNQPNNNLWFAINISANELLDNDILEALSRFSVTYQVPPEKLHLEITETQFLPYDDQINERLSTLRQLGFKLTLDDYGTGFTGFSQIMQFPGNYLKIDRSFIEGINNEDTRPSRMIDVMLDIADIHHLDVIAEGVETEQQLLYLQKRDCKFAQGYFLSRPLEWNELLLTVNRHHS